MVKEEGDEGYGGEKTSTVNNKDVTTLFFSPRTDPCHFWYISELVL